MNPGFESGDGDVAGTVKDWQTSGDLASYIAYNQGNAHAGYGRLAMYRAAAYKVSTFQTVNSLTNGTYTFSAWVAGATSGLNALYIYAKDYSSVATDQMKMDITPAASAAYTQITLTNVHVTSGKLTVGVYVDAADGMWANVDDVTLFRVQ